MYIIELVRIFVQQPRNEVTICDLRHFARVSVPLPDPWRQLFWKIDSLRNGTTLTSVSLTEQSASGDSDCIVVSVRMEHSLNVKF